MSGVSKWKETDLDAGLRDSDSQGGVHSTMNPGFHTTMNSKRSRSVLTCEFDKMSGKPPQHLTKKAQTAAWLVQN